MLAVQQAGGMQRQAKQQVSIITAISLIVILRLFRCVFSAATSSGQTFRIGKSITNAEGTVQNPNPLHFIALHCSSLLMKTSGNLKFPAQARISTFVPYLTIPAAAIEKNSDISTTHLR